METLISLAFKQDFSTSMGIWTLSSIFILLVYAWFNPSETEDFDTGFSSKVDNGVYGFILWALITYGLHSAGILN